MEFLLSADNVAANESMFSTNEGGEAWDSDGTLGTGWSDSGRESAPSGSSSASSVGDVPATTLVCTATCEQLPSSPPTAPPASPRLLAILKGWHLQAIPGFGSVLAAAGMPEDSYGSVTEEVRMRAIASHPQPQPRPVQASLVVRSSAALPAPTSSQPSPAAIAVHGPPALQAGVTSHVVQQEQIDAAKAADTFIQ